MISIKQFKPVSCLIAGGNLYDKILRQKDKLFEEEVIHISMAGSQNCNVLYAGSVLTLPIMKSIFFPFVHTSSRLWLTFMRKETSNKEAVYSCFLNGLPPHHDSLWALFSGSVTAYWYAQFSVPLHSSQISFRKPASPYCTVY